MITEQNLDIWRDSKKGPYKFRHLFGKDEYRSGIQLRVYDSKPDQYYWSLPDNGQDYVGPFATMKEALLTLNIVGEDKIKELST